jgi:CheY-like chemotaxis protein
MTMNVHPITIVMAEDDPEDRMLVKDAWDESMLNNDLRFVGDGEELMDYLRRTGKYAGTAASPRPGLILLDLNMPKKDGRAALEEIKRDPELHDIPIVILTSSAAEEDILRSYNLGVNSYITKPVTFDKLVEVLKTLKKYWLEIVELPENHGDPGNRS